MMRAVFLFLLLISTHLVAHEVRPALLQITETSDLTYSVIWKQPVNAGRMLNLDVEFPAHCVAEAVTLDQLTPTSLISNLTLLCTGKGLKDYEISIPGLSSTLTDVLLRFRWLDESTNNHIIKADSPSVLIEKGTSGLLDYLLLGIEHLLTGFDHVLFVIGLLYLGKTGWGLVRIITSFTLAHSITLGASALEWVQLPQGPVEAVIALSILFLAVEITRQTRASLLYRYPWAIAFVFGLLHGFGFASALRDIGLPADSLLSALFLFNVGVEIGQLMIVMAGLFLVVIVRNMPVVVPRWVVSFPVWGIGSLSAYWFMQRSLTILI